MKKYIDTDGLHKLMMLIKQSIPQGGGGGGGGGSTNCFNGSEADWLALTPEEQAVYDTAETYGN